MARFRILVTNTAERDIVSIVQYIREELHSPLTAKRYYEGLMEHLQWLEEHASVLPIQPDAPLYNDGLPIRRLNYKNVAIIYTISGRDVYVYHIIAQKLITYGDC
ncbi:MAG: type II toxin-antitoxin system RelE/ParE family toxin [Paludibacteraceae bacterium]|nr:type II toxin-antitoxin system RelE/ParE family toxin [Paludibacteraceae bacterium]